MAQNKKKKNKDESSRIFRFQRNYIYETNPKNGNKQISEKDWRNKVISECETVVSNYKKCNLVMVFHDQDRYTADECATPSMRQYIGKLKPLHMHGVVTFGDNKTQSLVMDKFGISAERNIQISSKKDVFLSYRYLTHRTLGAMQHGKAPYDTSSLYFIGFGDDILDSLNWDSDAKFAQYTKLCEGSVKSSNNKDDQRELEKNMVGQVCLKLLSGEIYLDESLKTLIDIFKGNVDNNRIALNGNDAEAMATTLYYSHKNKFQSAFNDYLGIKAKDKIKHDRNLTTGYIEGVGGSGKSQLAKGMAFVLDYGRAPHEATADGGKTTYDPVGNYEGERVSIFNEMEGSTLPLRQFCNVFDPHQFAPFGSRNHDINWIADHAIITESDTLSDWIDDKLKYGKGGSKYAKNQQLYKKDHYQVARRFTYYCSVHKAGKNSCNVVVYKFDDYTKGTVDPLLPFAPITSTLYHCDNFHDNDEMRRLGSIIIKDLGLMTKEQLDKAVLTNGDKLTIDDESKYRVITKLTDSGKQLLG